MTYSPDRLAYWYFRLNGFLTIENFIVHPDTGTSQRTDADLLAVRFKYRAENIQRPMTDDNPVIECDSFCNFIIAEIKSGLCALNGPWTDPEKENMQRVLRAIGCIDEERIQKVASQLYHCGIWQDDQVSIRLFAIGDRKAELQIPVQQQVTWGDVIAFLIRRFREYRDQKSSVGQWTPDGTKLRKLALKRDETSIRQLFGIPCNNDTPS